MAETALAVARLYDAYFIVNDYIEVARDIGADGVHVGYEDATPTQAKEALGDEAIIGGTGNTFSHIEHMYQQGVHYMGVGPFRYTNTKDELKPLLGLEGYQKLSQQMVEAGINTPVYAVGGLMVADVASLMETGIHGVAVSSAIGAAHHVREAAQNFLEEIPNN